MKEAMIFKVAALIGIGALASTASTCWTLWRPEFQRLGATAVAKEKEKKENVDPDVAMNGTAGTAPNEDVSATGQAPQNLSNEHSGVAAEQDGSVVGQPRAVDTGDATTRTTIPSPSVAEGYPADFIVILSSNGSHVTVTIAPGTAMGQPQKTIEDSEVASASHDESSSTLEAAGIPAVLTHDDTALSIVIQCLMKKRSKEGHTDGHAGRKAQIFKKGSSELAQAVIDEHKKLIAAKRRLGVSWAQLNEAHLNAGATLVSHIGD